MDFGKMKVWLFAVALVLALAPFSAEAKPKDGQTFGDWLIRCEGDRCQAFQRITQDGSTLLEVSFSLVPGSSDIGISTRVPLGISIPAGVAMKIDDAAQIPLPLIFCMSDGCHTALKLEKSIVTALAKSKRLLIGMLPQGSTTPVTINVSAKGLGDALKAFQ